MVKRIARVWVVLVVLFSYVLIPQTLKAQTGSPPEPTPWSEDVAGKFESQSGLRWLLLSRWRLLTTPASTPEEGAEIDEEAQFEAGRQAYLDNYCGTCHTLAAAGTGGIFGPSHDQIASVAAERVTDEDYRGSALTAEAYILESIVKPQIYLAPGSAFAHQQMPPYAHLDGEVLDALVYFLLQQE